MEICEGSAASLQGGDAALQLPECDPRERNFYGERPADITETTIYLKRFPERCSVALKESSGVLIFERCYPTLISVARGNPLFNLD